MADSCCLIVAAWVSVMLVLRAVRWLFGKVSESVAKRGAPQKNPVLRVRTEDGTIIFEEKADD